MSVAQQLSGHVSLKGKNGILPILIRMSRLQAIKSRFVEELFGRKRGHNNQRGRQSWFVQRKKQRRGFADWLLLGGRTTTRRTGP